MQTILILGAGVYQVPLIKAAKRMGLNVAVVSAEGDYPGIPLADRFYPIDTTNIEALVALATELNIDAVLTTGTDVAVPAIGAIVDALNLTGTGFDAALRSMDKALMKQAFAKYGVSTAAFEIVETLEAATIAAENIQYPVMVKAIDSSGSRGVSRVDSVAEMDAAWQYACSNTQRQQVIVEQCLEGVEFGAQAIVVDENVVAVIPHGDTVTPPPFSTPIGHSLPYPIEAVDQKALEALVNSAVKALGIKHTVANVDLMLCDGKPYILEIGARMGATCLPESVGCFIETDMYQFLIEIALGLQPKLQVKRGRANASMLLQSPQAGVVQSIVIPPEFNGQADILELVIDVNVGDKVNQFKVGPDRIGHIVVTGDTAESCEEKAMAYAASIQFKVV